MLSLSQMLPSSQVDVFPMGRHGTWHNSLWPWMRVPHDKKIIKLTNRFAEKLLHYTGIKFKAISYCFFYRNR